jgi:hypothetical protein
MGAPAPSHGSPRPADAAALRFAMLSVYYGSLGRELSSQGAPAMLLPLPTRPLGLEQALQLIKRVAPDHLRDAVWRVVRSVPRPPAEGARRGTHRYPPALADVLDAEHDLARLDELRAQYVGAGALAQLAALAVIEDRPQDIDGVLAALGSRPGRQARVVSDVLGDDPAKLADDGARGDARARLATIEREANLPIPKLAAQMADANAFLEWWGEEDGMTVLPAAASITQESDTLITRVTVTALVECDFAVVAVSSDPQCWDERSDVVVGTRYVRGSHDLRPLAAEPQPGRAVVRPNDPPLMLEEHVRIAWGFDEMAAGTFHNVLRVPRVEIDPATGTIAVDFSLARSIDSRILWDERPGGIVVDQGYLRVQPIAGATDRWRLTSHKTLLFSDRTPNAGGPGWTDFGQLSNYLAPAALSWWLESEMLSNTHETYQRLAKENP